METRQPLTAGQLIRPGVCLLADIDTLQRLQRELDIMLREQAQKGSQG